MKRRTEDELLNAAFGEISPEEAANIERFLTEDAEAAKAYSTYKSMREGLKGLREVPEHQLSTERLRTAILAQGLKPGRVSLGFNWLWAPAAAAVAVLGYIAMTRTPLIVERGSYIARNAPSVSAPSSESRPVPDDTLAVPIIEEPVETATVASIPRRERRARSLIVDQDSPIRVVAANTHYGPSRLDFEEDIDDLIVKNPRDRSDDGIILIQPERDNATGASRATEVESAKNVVIGG